MNGVDFDLWLLVKWKFFPKPEATLQLIENLKFAEPAVREYCNENTIAISFMSFSQRVGASGLEVAFSNNWKTLKEIQENSLPYISTIIYAKKRT